MMMITAQTIATAHVGVWLICLSVLEDDAAMATSPHTNEREREKSSNMSEGFMLNSTNPEELKKKELQKESEALFVVSDTPLVINEGIYWRGRELIEQSYNFGSRKKESCQETASEKLLSDQVKRVCTCNKLLLMVTVEHAHQSAIYDPGNLHIFPKRFGQKTLSESHYSKLLFYPKLTKFHSLHIIINMNTPFFNFSTFHLLLPFIFDQFEAYETSVKVLVVLV